MIEAHQLSKRYGRHVAVDCVSFTVAPGKVTGFLGPNGAGKSSTMRMIVGLSRPTSGRVLIATDRHPPGRAGADAASPLRSVGALLDAAAVDGARTGADHLRWLAHSNGIATRRIGEVLDLVGLGPAGAKRIGTYSLGMRQRLGIAGALLGDPPVLVFDEPVNGLDPDGILWFRRLCRQLADEGRTVFLSSHLMGEMAQTADHLVVIGAGRIVADAPVHEVVAATQGAPRVQVSTENPAVLARELERIGGTVTVGAAGRIQVAGLDSATVGRIAARTGVVLSELTPAETSLEEAFFGLIHAPTDPPRQPIPHAMTGAST